MQTMLFPAESSGLLRNRRDIRKEVGDAYPCDERKKRYRQYGKYDYEPQPALFFLMLFMPYLFHPADNTFYAGNCLLELYTCMRQSLIHVLRNKIHRGSDTGIRLFQMPALYHGFVTAPCKYVQTYRKPYYNKHRKGRFVKFQDACFSKMRGRLQVQAFPQFRCKILSCKLPGAKRSC